MKLVTRFMQTIVLRLFGEDPRSLFFREKILRYASEAKDQLRVDDLPYRKKIEPIAKGYRFRRGHKCPIKFHFLDVPMTYRFN